MALTCFSMPVFTEDESPVETVPKGYIWEEKSVVLPCESFKAFDTSDELIYVLGADDNHTNYRVLIYNKNAEHIRTLKLYEENGENYSDIYVSPEGRLYLCSYIPSNSSSIFSSITVYEVTGNELREVCKIINTETDKIYLSGNFLINEAETTVLLGNVFYNYKNKRTHVNENADYTEVDENGNLISYKTNYSNGRESELNSDYINITLTKYKDFSYNEFTKDFSPKVYAGEYRKPDLILQSGGNVLGYNYDKPNEVTLLLDTEKTPHIAFPLCTLDDKNIALVSLGTLYIYHNTMEKILDAKVINVAYTEFQGQISSLVYEFNQCTDEYEAVLSHWEKDRIYDIILLTDGGVMSGDNVALNVRAENFATYQKHKAKLVDMYELLGDSINDETTFMYMLESDETDGKLYTLTPAYEMTIPIAYAEYVDNNAFSSWEKVIELEKQTENWLFANYKANTLFYRFFPFVYIRNFEKGISDIDTPEFRSLLELCDLYKGGTQTDDEIRMRNNSPLGSAMYAPAYMYYADDDPHFEFVINDIRNKYYLSSVFNGSDANDDYYSKNIFTNYSSVKNLYFNGEKISFPGIPDMGQVVLTPRYDDVRVAVPDNYINKDGTKAFLHWICASPEENVSQFYITPSRLSLKASADAALKTPQTHQDENGKTVRDSFYFGFEKIETPDVTEEDVNELLSAFDGNVYISKKGFIFDGETVLYNNDFMYISKEYFHGRESFESLILKIERSLKDIIVRKYSYKA
jgi:hypothetical protein